MPRLMSFNKTIPQILDRSKTVTRRIGWKSIKPGDELIAVEKLRGVRVADRVEIARLRVVDVRREPLDTMAGDDMESAREGFPGMPAGDFVRKFCRAFGCEPRSEVARIEFEHVEEGSCDE